MPNPMHWPDIRWVLLTVHSQQWWSIAGWNAQCLQLAESNKWQGAQKTVVQTQGWNIRWTGTVSGQDGTQQAEVSVRRSVRARLVEQWPLLRRGGLTVPGHSSEVVARP